jgi:hypothetical protein
MKDRPKNKHKTPDCSGEDYITKSCISELRNIPF